MSKRAYIHTFGCQMNEYDSGRMMSLLSTSGYEPAGSLESADLIIVNTCSVRDKAEQKVFSFLGRLKKIKRKNDAIIAVGGCVAQQLGKKIFSRAPYVDIVFGTHNIDNLPDLLNKKKKRKGRVAHLAMQETPYTFHGEQYVNEGTVKAFVTIMQGCDNFCAYCIVPLLRGREYSRPPADVLQEVSGLAKLGVREVTLLGQNVNSYGKNNGSYSFPDLLRRVSEIQGIERIRFVTSHPRDFSDDLIECFADLDKLCPHVHLPAQSGSDSVLGRMMRSYTRNHYLSVIEKLKKARQDITFSSDFIVGFPGESDDDFTETLRLIEEVRYDSSFSFCFSPRSGTAAAEFVDQVCDELKKERLIQLQSFQSNITLNNYRNMIEKKVKVLVEGKSKTDDNKYTGRTECNKIVHFHNEEDVSGNTVILKITDAFAHHLSGNIVNGGQDHERG